MFFGSERLETNRASLRKLVSSSRLDVYLRILVFVDRWFEDLARERSMARVKRRRQYTMGFPTVFSCLRAQLYHAHGARHADTQRKIVTKWRDGVEGSEDRAAVNPNIFELAMHFLM